MKSKPFIDIITNENSKIKLTNKIKFIIILKYDHRVGKEWIIIWKNIKNMIFSPFLYSLG